MFDDPRLIRILELAKNNQFKHGLDPHHEPHGQNHWQDVANIAGAIAQRENTDVFGAQVFGLVHDCCRENDNDDPQHGPRAAHWITNSPKIIRLIGPETAQRVAKACEIHTLPITTQDPFCGACLDADRITLHRVGFNPKLKWFSTQTGKEFVTETSPIFQHDGPGLTTVFHGSKYPLHGPPKAQKGILYTALDKESAQYYGDAQRFIASFSKLADLRDPFGLLQTPIFKKIQKYQAKELKGATRRADGERLDVMDLLESGDFYHERDRSGQEDFIRHVFSWGYDAVLINDRSHSNHPTLALDPNAIVAHYDVINPTAHKT